MKQFRLLRKAAAFSLVIEAEESLVVFGIFSTLPYCGPERALPHKRCSIAYRWVVCCLGRKMRAGGALGPKVSIMVKGEYGYELGGYK